MPQKYLPSSVDLNNPKTFTPFAIIEYYDNVAKGMSGGLYFCGDCKHLDKNLKCSKLFRVKKIDMFIGPSEFAIVHKSCKSFDPDFVDSTEELERGVRRALDCNVQQYG